MCDGLHLLSFSFFSSWIGLIFFRIFVVTGLFVTRAVEFLVVASSIIASCLLRARNCAQNELKHEQNENSKAH
jgi:hypothetical protein